MTSDYIRKEVKSGCFYFDIKFCFKKVLKKIAKATYDTGCYHSSISYNLVADKNYNNIMHINDDILREKEKQKYIEYLKKQSILNPNVIITAGFGIESQSDKDMLEYSSIHNYIIGINRIKKIGIEKHKSTEQIQYMLRQYITNDILESIIKNKNVKYEYKVTGYEIAGMHIGDSRVQINYDHDNVALIGMYIIGKLQTKIFPTEDGHCLVATTGTEEDLKRYIQEIINDEYIDFSEQDYEANYIKSLIIEE